MVNKILKASGVQFKETRFLKPPKGTYAIYMDEVDADGPDYESRIFHHDITVELYSPDKPDPKAEAAIEAAIISAGLHYHKQARYWIREEQLYQTIYEFSYTEKT